MKHRILITGSNGLLGQKIVKQLSSKNEIQFLATSKGENRNPNLAAEYFKAMDITDAESIKSVADSFKPTAIINTAAMTNVDACEKDRENCWDINVNAVQYLLDYSKTNDVHLVHLSTDFVFDGEAGPYTETDKPNPLSYYGESKEASENLLIDSDYKNWSVVRTIIVYGKAPNMSRSNIVLWAKSALEKEQDLTIVYDQVRSPTWADDLAIGCLSVAEKEAYGIFHISGKDQMSIIELVRRVANFYNLDASKIKPIKSTALNQAAKRPPVTGFDLTKAQTILNYNPVSFEEGLGLLEKELNDE